MKFGKKGIAVGETVLWILGIFVVLVILYALFFPGQALSKVKDGALAFGYGLFPDQRKPEFEGESKVSGEVKSEFNELVSKFKSNGGEGACLIKLENGINAGEYLFTFSKVDKTIKIEEKKEDGFTLPYEVEKIENTPCIVNSGNFFSRYFNNKQISENNLIIEADLVINEDKLIYNGVSYSFEQDLLFKTKDNLCFFLVHSGWFTKWGCDVSGNTLDDDCTDKLIEEKKILECDA